MQKIIPFLWFNDQADEAARFYTAIFPNSKIGRTRRYSDGAPSPAGSVMAVNVNLDGQELVLFNGGPHFKFTEAVSLTVDCRDQKEVDRLWSALLEGGGKESQCGWLTDKFGFSWQIVPTILDEMLQDKDAAKAKRVMQAMMKMVKIDIAKIEEAYHG